MIISILKLKLKGVKKPSPGVTVDLRQNLKLLKNIFFAPLCIFFLAQVVILLFK